MNDENTQNERYPSFITPVSMEAAVEEYRKTFYEGINEKDIDKALDHLLGTSPPTERKIKIEKGKKLMEDRMKQPLRRSTRPKKFVNYTEF